MRHKARFASSLAAALLDSLFEHPAGIRIGSVTLKLSGLLILKWVFNSLLEKRGGMKHNPGFLHLVEQARRRVKECSVAEVKARLDRGDRFHFIDIREDHEFAKDHARGARHLGKGIIERDIESVVPDKQDSVVLYCGGG